MVNQKYHGFAGSKLNQWMRAEVGGSEIQGHLQLHQNLKINLASSHPISKTKQTKYKGKLQ